MVEKACLQPYGMGALGKHGDYWYPVRLLNPRGLSDGRAEWVVEWWRQNRYATSEAVPLTLPLDRLEDSCFGNAKRHRQIRISSFANGVI